MSINNYMEASSLIVASNWVSKLVRYRAVASMSSQGGSVWELTCLLTDPQSSMHQRPAGFPGLGGPGAGTLGSATAPASTVGAPGSATAPAPMAARGNAAVEKGGRKKDPFADLMG